jgi:predicted RNA binding protein YcfA (HicA-like mRNA interferase family)
VEFRRIGCVAGFSIYGRRVPKTVRQIERILSKHGWRCVRIAGSHRQWTHPDNPHVVTVPGSSGKLVPVGTLSSIRRASGIKELR